MSTLGSVILRDVIANRPAAAIPGRLFFASDTAVNYRDNGTTWDVYSGGGTGSVTSVAMTVPSWLTVGGSPITGTGTLAVTGTSEAQNLFLASPNGSSGAMTPRAIVAADLPGGSVFNFANNEILVVTSGPTIPALAHTPNPLNSLKLYWQGARQRYTTDFTVSGTAITPVTFTPSVGDNLIADYQF